MIYYFYNGGSQILLLDTLKSLSNREDIQNNLVIMAGVINEEYKEELLSTNTNIYIFPENGHKNRLKSFIKLLKIVIENRIDLIHYHDLSTEKWAILLKLMFPKIKLVYTLHDMHQFFSKPRVFIKNFFVDVHIAISKSVLNYFSKFSVKRISLIYNGIRVKDFSTYRANLNLNTNVLRIINVARIQNSIKGQDILVKALNECKKNNLKFTCDFAGGVYSYDTDSIIHLKELVNNYNLENEVSFLGHQSNIEELLSNYDVFVLPSRSEGFGLVLLEAMAVGLPVIASNIGGPAEIIKHGHNGLLFERENHVDLSDKIRELYSDRNKLNQISKTGLGFVQQFDISTMSEKYYELYKALIKGKGKY